MLVTLSSTGIVLNALYDARHTLAFGFVLVMILMAWFACSYGSVTSLAYHPSHHMVATTSSSGELRVWVQQEGSRRYSAAHWRCQSSGTHAGKGVLPEVH